MAHEIQPDHTQRLTPRENEVLELLRLGLTNREIAERLGISVDGAKYHVSEIIAKLGVRSRHEAARWPEPSPWWARALAPVALLSRRAGAALPVKPSALALALSGVLLAVVLAGLGLLAFLLASGNGTGGSLSASTCPSREQPVFRAEEELTLEEVRERMAEAIDCPGYAFHLQVAEDWEEGPSSGYYETEVWVDLASNRSRKESPPRYGSEETRREASGDSGAIRTYYDIVDGRTQYVRQENPGRPAVVGKREAEPASPVGACYGFQRRALELAYPCWGEDPITQRRTWLEQNVSYGGRDAVAIASGGNTRGSDGEMYVVSRLFISRESFLPIGMAYEGWWEPGVAQGASPDVEEISPVQADIRHAYEFVRLDSLPRDLMDPASIGIIEDSYEQDLDGDEVPVAVYWLGRTFRGDSDLPGLTLRSAFIPGLSQPPEPQHTNVPAVRLNYGQADDEEDDGSVWVEVYRSSDWEALLEQPSVSVWPIADCERGRELELADREATICEDYGEYEARVLVGDALVRIRAHGWYEGGTWTRRVGFYGYQDDLLEGATYVESPYNSLSGMELLVEGLRALE